jgi:hypothetical protein
LLGEKRQGVGVGRRRRLVAMPLLDTGDEDCLFGLRYGSALEGSDLLVHRRPPRAVHELVCGIFGDVAVARRGLNPSGGLSGGEGALLVEPALTLEVELDAIL